MMSSTQKGLEYRPAVKDAAPQNMWWVAWRQHRLQIAILLAVGAAAIAAMVIFRQVAVSKFTDAGCDLMDTNCQTVEGFDVWYNGLSTWASLLMLCVLGAPIALGAFAGSIIFTREFAHGTQVFALTQSVSRRRWWAVKVSVLAVPVLVDLLAIGYVSQWVQGTFGYTAHGAMRSDAFLSHGPIPAVVGLAVFALAVTAGILIRNVIGSLVAALGVGVVLLFGLAAVQPHLVPTSRATVPIEQVWSDNNDAASEPWQLDLDASVVRGGYLDAEGRELNVETVTGCYQKAGEASDASFPKDESGDPVYNEETSVAANKAWASTLSNCAQSKGIVSSYTDYLPGSMLWPLRGVFSGLCVVLAALALVLGSARLSWAAAKR